MALLSPDDQQRLRDEFSEMTRRVHLLFFTQTVGCETCLVARQILDELPPLSDNIVIDEINLVLERDRAAAYGVERAPSIAVAFEEPGAGGEAPALRDSRIRFVGAPAGYEFVSLVNAVSLAGGRASELSTAAHQQLAALDRPLTVQVFTTPT